MRMADRAPPQRGHANFHIVDRNLEIRDGIGEIADAFDHCGVDAVLHHHLLERGAYNEGLARDHVLPGQDAARAVDARQHAMRENGPVAAAANVVLAAPHHLDRALVLRRLHDMRRLGRHLGCRRCAPSEASAREYRFDLDLLRLEPQHGRGHGLIQRLRLAAIDQLNAVLAVRRMTQSFGSMGACAR